MLWERAFEALAVRGGEGDVCFFRRGGVRRGWGALCDCAAQERCRRRLEPLFADLDGESASDVRGKGAMCDRLEERRFEEADGERSEKGKGAVRGDAFHCADCRAVRIHGIGFVRRFISDVRKSGNGGLCARGLALGVDSGALSLRGARTMGAAVEAAFRWLGWGIGGQCVEYGTYSFAVAVCAGARGAR